LLVNPPASWPHQAIVAGRDVDLGRDPPPDWVVAIDITHTDISKLQRYAAMGVPEFWRYNGEAPAIGCAIAPRAKGDRTLLKCDGPWLIYSPGAGGFVQSS
jgi:hypothetical protein